MKPWFRCIVFVFAMSTSFADAQQPPDAGIEVVRPWARASTGLAQPAAAYLSIVNKGAQPIVLTGITVPCERAMLCEWNERNKSCCLLVPASNSLPGACILC